MKLLLLYCCFFGFSLFTLGQTSEEIDSISTLAKTYPYHSDRDWKTDKKFFKTLKQWAEETQNPILFYHLGVFKKEGVGTKPNAKKSKRFFKTSFDLGHLEAAYPIGYYHLKGIGEIPQNYQLAYNWFKKANSPMGTHWMAKMHYFGWGKKQNKNKALKLLEGNDLTNSKVLLPQFKFREPPANIHSDILEDVNPEALFTKANNPNNQSLTQEMLTGSWSGEWMEYDWSKKSAIRKMPVSLKFDNIPDNQMVSLSLADSVYTLNHYLNPSLITFNEAEIIVPKQFTDYPSFTHHKVELPGLTFLSHSYSQEGEEVLVLAANGHVPLWDEPYPPTLLILRKTISISDQALAAFDAQEGEVIKTYPNPFEKEVLVNFELNSSQTVTISLTNGYGTPTYQKVLFNQYLEEGNRTLRLEELPETSGYYTLNIEMNGELITKTIIRN